MGIWRFLRTLMMILRRLRALPKTASSKSKTSAKSTSDPVPSSRTLTSTKKTGSAAKNSVSSPPENKKALSLPRKRNLQKAPNKTATEAKEAIMITKMKMEGNS